MMRSTQFSWFGRFISTICIAALASMIAGRESAVLAGPGIYRDHVEPHWFAGHSKFWYRNDLREGMKEFVLVDAETGSRTAAFDAARVAAEFNKFSGALYTPNRLPIDDLDFERERGAVILSRPGGSWRLDLGTYALTPVSGATAEDSLPAGKTPHPSVNGDHDTSIIFVNRTDGPVDLFWINNSGRRTSYGTIAAGAEHAQNTYVGHAWIALDAHGRTLGVFDAIEKPATAIIKPVVDRPPNRSKRPHHNTGQRDGHRGPDSPDGKWIAIEKEGNLYLHKKSGGDDDLPLSHDGTPDNAYAADRVWWSADSQKLVAMRIEPGQEHKIYTVESSPADQAQPKLRTLNYLKPGDRIDHPRPSLFNLADRRQIPIKEDLFPTPWSIDDVRWAADGSRFTFVYNQRGHQILRVIAVDANTGDARAIVDETSPTFIDYSGKYFCTSLGDDELIWMSERDGWNHLWLYDARLGKPKNLITRGEWVVQDVVYVDAEHRQVWFNAGGVRPGQDPYFTHFCRADFDGSHLTILTEGDGDHHVQWSPGDRYLIDTWSRVDHPPTTELRQADTGKLLCRLEEADARETLQTRGDRWPEPFVAPGRDGTTPIYGVIFFPQDFDPAKTYPVLEEIYAGPQAFYTPKSFHLDYGRVQKLANMGMIVVQCDGMGTSGRSKKFHDVCWKNLRDAGFPDRIAWIKAAAAKHPQMDLTRVGIFGGSAGGQNAMAALLWHHDFYKVAVADCGCHDNRMDKIWWNEQWMGWPVDKSYEENSNTVNARLLEGKLMLIFGELDDNVDPSSTMQVVNALEKANKDFELVIVTGAHHGSAETPYGSRRREQFLEKNLIRHGD